MLLTARMSFRIDGRCSDQCGHDVSVPIVLPNRRQVGCCQRSTRLTSRQCREHYRASVRTMAEPHRVTEFVRYYCLEIVLPGSDRACVRSQIPVPTADYSDLSIRLR